MADPTKPSEEREEDLEELEEREEEGRHLEIEEETPEDHDEYTPLGSASNPTAGSDTERMTEEMGIDHKEGEELDIAGEIQEDEEARRTGEAEEGEETGKEEEKNSN